MASLPEILGCRYPVLQGPVGALNSPKLVAAICEAGAYGMLALGFVNRPDQVKAMVDEVKDITSRPFGANVMIINPESRRILEILAEAGVKTVTTSVGAPGGIYPIIHDLGMRGFHVLLSLSHALKAEDAGVDGLIVSGFEAGGLRSRNPESSTMVIVPLVADHVSIPIVAAGGIADSRGYRAALALGADGVQLGTRFIASDESPAHESWKQAIVQCGDGGTSLVPMGNMKMRAILNDKLEQKMADPDLDISREYNLMNAPRAWNIGDFDLVPAGGGQVGALIRDIRPVKEIIEEMVSRD